MNVRSLSLLRRKNLAATPDKKPGSSSLFRAFSKDDFIHVYGGWKALERLLAGNGGAFGIAGPRGSGKTWLISRGVQKAKDSGGVGLWFPTPSDYGAEPFLSALADNFASEVMKRLHPVLRWFPRVASPWVLLVSLLILLFLFYFRIFPDRYILNDLLQNFRDYFYSENLEQMSPLPLLLLEFSIFLLWVIDVILLVGVGAIFFLQNFFPNGYLYFKAVELKQRIRYAETLSRGQESSVKLGDKSNLGFALKTQQSLAERALTIASLVYEFRGFLQEVAQKIRAPIVIGIDELDKIHDTEKAKALLRDIKGIFEVDGVSFLVSISDEAKKRLNLGAMQERDEFNSSFMAVVDLLPNTPAECSELIEMRSPRQFDPVARLAIGILGGGNLREVLRLADKCLPGESPEIGAPEAILVILRSEAHTIRSEILTADISEIDKLNIYRFLDPEHFTLQQLLKSKINLPRGESLFDTQENTELDTGPSNDRKDVIKLWDRVRVRFIVAQVLLGCLERLDDPKLSENFQQIIITISNSPAVAEHTLEKLIVDPDAPKPEVQSTTVIVT